MDKQRIYFPNLNGLRFIAALLVIIHHIEQFKSIFKIDNYWTEVPFIWIIGKLGVILFFVLSGFLITYLLLAEEHVQREINIKAFYIRRILRIWPLYFLIIFLALVIFPQMDLFTLPGYGKELIYKNVIFKILLYILFLPNLVLALLGVVPFASHTWSIGTEEQFYLVWPVILKYIKKYRIALMLGIVFCYLFINTALNSQYSDFIPHKGILASFWKTFNIDCMAIGGFFAIVLYQKNTVLKVFLNKYVFYLTMLITAVLMIKGVYIQYIKYELYAILFGIIILNFAANHHISISLENSVLNYLGKISYGLYMYHPIGIVMSVSLAKSTGMVTNWLIYPVSIAITILIAGISYKYYESVFLKFKPKFSKVISGDSAHKGKDN